MPLFPRYRRLALGCAATGAAVVMLAAFRPQQVTLPVDTTVTPNYDLAAQWTAAKTETLVFDTAVTPHWYESGDRFWYSFKTGDGTGYTVVDPARGTKSALFDRAAMAVQLTRLTGLPYDAQHLPLQGLKLIRQDTALQFALSVPRTAVIPGLGPETAAETEAEQGGGGGGGGRGGRGGRGGEAAPVAGANQRLVHFEYDFASGQVKLIGNFQNPERKPSWATISPDGKTILFARGENLYMMDAASYALAVKNVNDPAIQETQLTTDGVKDYSYGRDEVNNADEDLGTQGGGRGARGARGGRGGSAAAQRDTSKNPRRPTTRVIWSKDSSKFALTRTDNRNVADLWVIHSLHRPRPTLETYKYAMPGEANVPQSEVWIFDVASKKATKVNATAFPDQRLEVETEPVTYHEREAMPPGEQPASIWLGGATDKFYLMRMSRDMHRMDYCVVNTNDGSVKPFIEERQNVYMLTKPLRLVNHGTEALEWSERDGWAHYYLYGTDGTLKGQVDKGQFMADNIVAVDDTTGTLYFTAEGYKDGESPYNTHLFRVGLDGTGMRALDADDAHHAVVASDDGKYFVDTYSRVDTAPESDLYSTAGKVAKLESADLKALMAAGYQFPTPYTVKADDGVTDLYGVMFKPFDFDPHKKYPLIEYVYPGPQEESVDTTFNPRSQHMTLAQFGFIVIEVGNRGGSPLRDNWYHTYGYGNLRDYGLADKKRAAEELAQRYSFIDLNRVGITGHSGGGFMSTAAILVYPEFFKVAVSESGNHDNSIYNRNWSEEHNGVQETDNPDGTATFRAPVDENSSLAGNLKGHLLLSTGDMDNNVSMANTMRLANALIRANKQFDLVMLPGERHGYSSDTNYFFWRKANYFCQYLLGSSPHGADMVELQREVAETGKQERQ